MAGLAGRTLAGITSGRVPTFALLHRAEDPHRVEVLAGPVRRVPRLSGIPLRDPRHAPPGGCRDTVALLPFRQVAERGFDCRDDAEPILALTVDTELSVPTDDLMGLLPDVDFDITDGSFDLDDERYCGIVRAVLRNEIGHGAGSNFVIRRTFQAEIPNYSPLVALTIFRRLLAGETGAYWTFVVHTDGRTFVGASPEQHVGVRGGQVSMNPISGTYRYPAGGPSVPDALRFLADEKEADELYMVVDEELKMMGRVCDVGVRVTGPRLLEMTRVAHTGYVLRGRSGMALRDILRETMFAPTVTGSPVRNACRVIERYEPRPRGYYGGVLAVFGRDGRGHATLDSAILIRTADIETVDGAGRLRLGVGATLVRGSDPQSEAAETRAKAAALLAVLRRNTDRKADGNSNGNGSVDGIAAHPAVRSALSRRNATLAPFWLSPPAAPRSVPRGAAGRVLLVDAEDAFTSMIAHHLRSLDLDATALPYDADPHLGRFDLVVAGPGPGDPQDPNCERCRRLRALLARLLRTGSPFLAVCLSHQVLSNLLGLPLVRRDVPNQGTQRMIDLFGSRTRVGFYNTFVARSVRDRFRSPAAGGVVEVSRDPGTGEVHALRGPRFVSLQFHLESILTTDGLSILREALASLLPGERAA
jgi:phenazine biosynthesis protein phzE